MTHMLLFGALLAIAADDPPAHVSKYLARCEAAKVGSIGMPLPPAKDDIGTLDVDAIAVRAGRGVLVLEVVGDDEAIVRIWYQQADAPQGRPPEADDLTFVDLWLEGIDTRGLVENEAAKLAQVFHVAGNKLFDTTCGKRSLPLLRPIDVERYRMD